LSSLDRGRRLQAVVEVEAGESVNHLKALSGRANLAKIRPAFHLYAPSTMVDVARRLCEDNRIVVTEIWSFHGIGDDVRFTLVHKTREVPPTTRRAAPPAAPAARRPPPPPRAPPPGAPGAAPQARSGAGEKPRPAKASQGRQASQSRQGRR